MDAFTRSFNDAARTSGELIRRAKYEGITVRAFVRADGPDLVTPLLTWERQSSVAVTAASINKLALALWMLDTYDDAMLAQRKTWTQDDVRQGGGTFDADDAPHEATYDDLLYDMLANSGNTAVAVLGYVNFNIANALLHKRGYEVTRFMASGAPGRFETGMTTPRESARLIEEILAYPADTDAWYVARDALAASPSWLERRSGHEQWSKHGDLNGDRMSHEYLRAETGMLTCGGRTVTYALFAGFSSVVRTAGRLRAARAERLIGRIGDTFACVLGSTAPVATASA